VYLSNTRLTKAPSSEQDGSFVHVKIHFKSNQGVHNMTNGEAAKIAGENPDYHLLDLHDSIDRGDFPSWTMFIQVMKPEQAETYRWNVFDMTQVWPHADFPLIPVGKLTLNENVSILPSSSLLLKLSTLFPCSTSASTRRRRSCDMRCSLCRSIYH
jgi:hypothetical protein